MPDRLRVGIVGASFGRQHAAAYRSLPETFDLRVICDLDAGRAQAAADLYGVPGVATELAALLERPDLDLIDLCTPAYLHQPQALQALAAGKHVIVEKPVAGSLQQADQLLAAEAQSGRRVMPIFQYRFGRGLQKLKFLQEQGLTGRAYLSTVETAWRRRPAYYASPWRGRWQTDLGGPLVSLAIHAHDALAFILGPARRVSAHLATLVNPIETEDCAAIALELNDGSLATLAVTTGSAVEITRHRFCFSRFTAESNTRPYDNTSDEWTFRGDTPEIEAQVAAALERFSPQPEGLAGQFDRFGKALSAGQPLPVSLPEARASLELVTAIYAAARAGQAVELPILSTHPLYAGWQPE